MGCIVGILGTMLTAIVMSREEGSLICPRCNVGMIGNICTECGYRFGDKIGSYCEVSKDYCDRISCIYCPHMERGNE